MEKNLLAQNVFTANSDIKTDSKVVNEQKPNIITKLFYRHNNKALVIAEEDKNQAILICNFTKQFKKFKAVDNANIKVRAGTIHGFIGPNGSGKTTTIKCLISAMLETNGDLLVHDKRSWTVEAKKMVGYIPEAARFPKRISTYDYLISMGELSGLTAKEAKSKSEAILKELDLWKFKKRNPNAYSSGMKKKVLLAQALLNNPSVLILDEPAANLDPTARTELFNDLRKLRDQGKTVFISSHILSELQHLADEVTVLNYSKVVYSGVINKSESMYEISTNNSNGKLQKLLESNDFKVKVNNKTLLVKISSESEVATILQLALKEKIIITFLKPYSVDLQSMYERIVMEASNKNKKGEN